MSLSVLYFLFTRLSQFVLSNLILSHLVSSFSHPAVTAFFYLLFYLSHLISHLVHFSSLSVLMSFVLSCLICVQGFTLALTIQQCRAWFSCSYRRLNSRDPRVAARMKTQKSFFSKWNLDHFMTSVIETSFPLKQLICYFCSLY